MNLLRERVWLRRQSIGLPWVTILFAMSHVFSGSAAVGNLAAWGDGTGTFPSGLTNLMGIAANRSPAIFLRSDGTVVGQTGLSNVAAIGAGYIHGLAARSNGTVAAWGSSLYGETTIPTDLTNAIAVAGGYYDSLALKNDGTVTAWGYNWWGACNVPSGLSNVVAIAAGYYQSLALKRDGRVVAWGYDHQGQQVVPAGLSNVVAIAAGENFDLALKSDGKVVAWGLTESGQTSLPSNLSNVVAIAAGDHHGLALKNDGTVVAWGYNTAGQTNVPLGLSNVVAIAAGGYHSLALTNNGTPSIAWQPLSKQVYSGSTTTLGVGAVGAATLAYQWQFNGADIEAATNSALILTNLQTSDEGDYRVVVTNVLGAITSAVAHLGVLVSVPIISGQPMNKVTVSGTNVAFTVNAEGSQPISYQWQFNGSDLPNETNASLVLTKVRPSNAGNYRAVVINLYDSAITTNATLTILPFRFAVTTGIPLFPEMRTNGFRMRLDAVPADATNVLIYASTNCLNWEPIASGLPFLGLFSFTDRAATNLPLRFYRAEARY